MVLFAVPAAFSGVCTFAHLPPFIESLESFKQLGVDEIICTSVNGPYAMNGWQESLDPEHKISFYADFDGSFADYVGKLIPLDVVNAGKRSHRYSLLLDNGVITASFEEAGPPTDLKVTGEHP